MKVRYKVVQLEVDTLDDDELARALNEYVEQGYRLVAITPACARVILETIVEC